MLFDTPAYLFFLSLVVITYWHLNFRWQNFLLLIASYVFYGWWDYRFLSLIFISTVVDYYSAHFISNSHKPLRRKIALIISLSINLGFLSVFKYYNFFADSFAHFLALLGMHVSHACLRIILPPAISFYTFQALAYIVDVYYHRLKPADSLIDYALFISLFPHLIAGPIQKPSHLLPQVQRPRVLSMNQLLGGLVLIASGLFRKCVIADNCALLADAAFEGKLGQPNLAVTAIGTYAFAWQIYGDFSGYSDIARGSAQLLGFHFPINFRQPYFSLSLQEFWRRWHISLSSWLRDYLYVPLGGNRNGELQTNRNIFVTMLIAGLWHGANWTFVLWGAIHGLGLCIERIFRSIFRFPKTHSHKAQQEYFFSSPVSFLKLTLTFHVVCFTWVCFRAPSINDAFQFLKGITRLAWMPEYATAFLFLAIFTAPLFVIDLVNEWRREEYPMEKHNPFFRVVVALSLVVASLIFAGNSTNAFIYFQF